MRRQKSTRARTIGTREARGTRRQIQSLGHRHWTRTSRVGNFNFFSDHEVRPHLWCITPAVRTERQIQAKPMLYGHTCDYFIFLEVRPRSRSQNRNDFLIFFEVRPRPYGALRAVATLLLPGLKSVDFGRDFRSPLLAPRRPGGKTKLFTHELYGHVSSSAA